MFICFLLLLLLLLLLSSSLLSFLLRKALKPKLASHKEFEEMSEKFVMVNTEDDEEPKGSQFIVDGEYVPRILFLGKAGHSRPKLLER